MIKRTADFSVEMKNYGAPGESEVAWLDECAYGRHATKGTSNLEDLQRRLIDIVYHI
jgi:hypothetical protein